MLSKVLCLLALAAAVTITAKRDTADTFRNTPVTTSVLANDTSSGAALDHDSVTIATPSANGTATVNPSGTITFTPDPGFVGITTYNYRVCDTSTPTPICATAKVTVNVVAPLAGGGTAPQAKLPTIPPTPPPSSTPGGIRISIKNGYKASFNLGPLGSGSRKGTDTAKGVLTLQGNQYVGIVDADVDSTLQVSGLGTNCGPARFVGAQKLKVIGRPVDGFNPLVQTVNPATMTGQASNEYLSLEFAPETMASQQRDPRPPEAMLPELVVNCHSMIDTLSGIAFMPLNDTRWTMEGGGYTIRLPSSGVLDYTDKTVATGGQSLGPFNAEESIWTIQVERLP